MLKPFYIELEFYYIVYINFMFLFKDKLIVLVVEWIFPVSITLCIRVVDKSIF